MQVDREERGRAANGDRMSGETKIKSMGAIPHAGGVGFRVWAPNAQRVSVIGSFNDWDGDKHPMQAEENDLLVESFDAFDDPISFLYLTG